MQAQARRTQRREPVIGERAAYGQTVAAHHRSLLIHSPLDRSFDRAHAAHLLLEFLLGVPVGLEDGPRGLAQVVELAELVRHTGQDGGDRVADRMLPIGNHPDDGYWKRGDHLPQQGGQIVASATEQTARQEHLARQAIA